MKKIFTGLITLLAFLPYAKAQQPPLAGYIDSALANNIVLRQKDIALQQAVYALKSARGMFYPSIDLQGQYLSATGGRSIEIPVGDMLNGVYTTLNQLTQSQTFPQLSNESINFLPANFYDAKVHTTVPILNTSMIYNKRIKQQQVALSSYEVAVYERALVAQVKTAYYAYLQALDAVRIYESALGVAQEGRRVNERLLDNGKGLPAYVLRAKSEVEQVKAQLMDAGQQVDNAKRYFNFLLNRNQEAAIDTAGASAPEEVAGVLQSISQKADYSGREELKALTTAIQLQENVYKMKKAVFYPSLNGFFDAGSQAENWQFNEQSRYLMFGLQLSIPLFAGNRNRYEIQQSKLALDDARLDLEQRSRQLSLNSQVSVNKLRSAYYRFLSAQKQLAYSEAYQRLISRGYREGANTYIETVDAQSQLTRAQIAVSISRYQMLSAKAELERATASYNLSQTQ